MIGAVVLGLAAAFLFALSAFLQQRAARRAIHGDSSAVLESTGLRRLLHKLPRSKTWLSGWLTNMCGWVTQAGALKVGSIATVQPLMSSQLVFVVAMASARQRHWPKPRDWLSALAVCAGLVVLLTAEGGTQLDGSPRRVRLLLSTACMVALIVALLLISRASAALTASMLVGMTSGLCHALNAMFMKLTIEDLTVQGVAGTAADWPGYALAASTLTGLVLGQLAFAGGPLPPAIAAITVTNPLASLAVGLLAFNEARLDAPRFLAAIAVSGVLIAVGITGLAHAPITRRFYARAGHAGTPTDDVVQNR